MYGSHVSIEVSADLVRNLEANLYPCKCFESSKLYSPAKHRLNDPQLGGYGRSPCGRDCSVPDLHGTPLRFIAYPHGLTSRV